MLAKLIPVGGGPTIPIVNDVTVVCRKHGLCDLVVERDQSDPNRLNFLLPPDLINQLMVTAASLQFRL